MKFKQVAVLAATVLFATAAFSGDKVHQKMEIKVVSDDGSGESVVVLDSDTLGFDMHEMQVGENRSVVDKNGRAVLITRNEDGFALDVDGKTIDLPAIRRHHDGKVWAHQGGDPMGKDGVLIFSGKEIDAATQELIRTTLATAGHNEVRFADGSEGGPHQVHVIKEIHEKQKISE